MKAAICRAFGAPLTIEDVTLAPPRQGEVEVTLAACAICQSDIHLMDGVWGGTLPAVYGHEAAGHVTALGDGVKGAQIGQPVLVTLIRACGHCACCAAGRPTICKDPGARPSPLTLPDGSPITHGIDTAAFAEKVVVDQSQIAPLPDDIALDIASVMACAVITGTGAVFNTARQPSGTTALVIGAGGVGLNSIQAARIAGARKVIALDLAPEKLQAAREFGASDTLAADAPDLRARLMTLTGGLGADYVYVTVGAVSAYEQALTLLAPGGTLVMAGMTGSGDTLRVDASSAAYCEHNLKGSRMGGTVLSRDIPRLVDYYRQGRLKLDELISNRYPLERINEAIDEARKGNSRRNVILFGDAP